MELFDRKFIIGLAVLAVFAASAAAVQNTPPYPLEYWITGTLNKGTATSVENYKVVLYSTSGQPAQAFALARTDAGGKFAINAFEDMNLKLLPGPYYMGVVSMDGYGVNETTVQLEDKGFTVKDLTLAAGQGILDPEDSGLINSTVIERVADAANSGIRLKWDYDASLQTKRADIWRIAGKGQSYLKNEMWVKIYESQANEKTFIDNVDNPTVAVGNDTCAYYRVIPLTNAKVGDKSNSVKLFFPADNARTVAKVDVALKKATFGLVYVPLQPCEGDDMSWTFQNMFGGQIIKGEAQRNDKGLASVLCNNGVWETAKVKLFEAFWVQDYNADTICTFVGKVLTTDYIRSIISGYDLYGYPQPLGLNFTAGSNAGVGMLPEINDDIEYNSGGLVGVPYMQTGWGGQISIGLGGGFWYGNFSIKPRSFGYVP